MTSPTRNFACVKFCLHTFQEENNKGADQTAQMRRLVRCFVVCIQQYQVSHMIRRVLAYLFGQSRTDTSPQSHVTEKKK